MASSTNPIARAAPTSLRARCAHGLRRANRAWLHLPAPSACPPHGAAHAATSIRATGGPTALAGRVVLPHRHLSRQGLAASWRRRPSASTCVARACHGLDGIAIDKRDLARHPSMVSRLCWCAANQQSPHGRARHIVPAWPCGSFFVPQEGRATRARHVPASPCPHGTRSTSRVSAQCSVHSGRGYAVAFVILLAGGGALRSVQLLVSLQYGAI